MLASAAPRSRAARLNRAFAQLRDTAAVMRDPLRFLEAMAREGDAVPVRFLGGWSVLVLSHPDDIEHVLVHDRDFPKRHPFLPEMKRFIGEGLATSEGELWRRQRRLVQHAFLRERVTAYADDLAAATARMLEGWQDGEVHDLYADLMRLVLRGTARTLFSTDVDGDSRDIVDAVAVVMDRFANPLFLFMKAIDRLPLPSARRLRDAKIRLDAIIDGVIASRRASSPEALETRRDLLGALMAARAEDASGMSDKQLHDEVITLFIAGFEPTAVALAWTFHLLLKHPAAMARAAEEARSVLGDRVATRDDVARLAYVRHAIDEALRLFPPAWTIVRESAAACSFRGHDVPAGGSVWFSPWVPHRDPRWYDAPTEYRPERWADGLAKRIPRGAYMPYGAGPRMCVGAPLAAEEMPRVVGMILARLRLDPIPGRDPVPYPSINLRPRGGVWARASRR